MACPRSRSTRFYNTKKKKMLEGRVTHDKVPTVMLVELAPGHNDTERATSREPYTVTDPPRNEEHDEDSCECEHLALYGI